MTLGQNWVLRYGHFSDFLGKKFTIWVRLMGSIARPKNPLNMSGRVLPLQFLAQNRCFQSKGAY